MSTLAALCEKLQIRCEATYGAVEVPEGWAPGTHPYKVRLRFRGRSLTVPFFMGSGNTREPSAADVLSCLVSDVRAGEQSFEDFCGDMGLDSDSRKAEATYRACERMAPRVRKFLRDSFDAIEGAEH